MLSRVAPTLGGSVTNTWVSGEGFELQSQLEFTYIYKWPEWYLLAWNKNQIVQHMKCYKLVLDELLYFLL